MYKKKLPNATTVLVLGIVSIVTSFCYGIIGIILSIIALVLSKKDLKLYRENPEEYDGYQDLNTGRICAIVGLCLGILFFLFFLVYIIFMVWTFIPLFSQGAS
jgi:M penetrans paralogue family 26